MTALALCLLALVDAAFAGFRNHAGRDGRISKRPAELRAAGHGALLGLAALAVLAAGLLTLLATGAVSYQELESAGRRMLAVYAVYATVVAVGFAAYFSPDLELQSLGATFVLGPGTAVRPLVILGGVSWAAAGAASGWVAAAAVAAAVLMLLIGVPMGRHHARRLAHHPFR